MVTRGQEDADRRTIAQVYAALGIPGNDDPDAYAARVRAVVDPGVLATWQELRDGPYDERFHAAAHHDLATAMVLSAGARSDLGRAEAAALLGLLRRDLPAPLSARTIVEVGAGSGVTAAIVSLATGARVIAVDESPAATATIARVAEATGARVEARTGRAEELAAVLGDVRADALCLFATLHYVAPHHHVAPVFTLTGRLRDARAFASPAPGVAAMLAALPPAAPVYLSDEPCPDRVAELDALVAGSGRALDLGDCRMLDGHMLGTARRDLFLVARPGGAPVTPAGILALFVGPPPRLRAGEVLEDLAAEGARHALGSVETLRSREVIYRDGSGVLREEVGRAGALAFVYVAATTGHRSITGVDRRALGDLLGDFDGAPGRLAAAAMFEELGGLPGTEW